MPSVMRRVAVISWWVWRGGVTRDVLVGGACGGLLGLKEEEACMTSCKGEVACERK